MNIFDAIILLLIGYEVIMTLRLLYLAPLRRRYIDESKSLEELNLLEKVELRTQCRNLLLWTFKQVQADIHKHREKKI